MKRILVLGGGVGGTIVANLLARKARGSEVTVVDRRGRHVYQPGFLYLAFGRVRAGRLVREEETLLDRRVKLVVDEAVRVDPDAMVVHLREGGELPYDYLVIATGAQLVPQEVPGWEDAHHFYSLTGAQRLRDALGTFDGGRIVIAIGGVPYKCPPAPAEAACLLHEHFVRRGIRDQVDIHYLSPLARVFMIESVSPAVQRIFDEHGIRYTTFFNVERVDSEKHVVHSLEGESVPYDLLLLVPPHRGVPFAKASGFTDAGGWIRTDKETLEVKGHEGTIWALGDATDIPISKAGATAHYQAKVVAKNVAALVRGRVPTARYDGKVMCFFDAGFGRAFLLKFDYAHAPALPKLSRRWHFAKVALNRLYWRLVARAWV